MSGRYIVYSPYIHLHAQVVTLFNPIRILEKGTIIIVNAGCLYQIKVRLYASVFSLGVVAHLHTQLLDGSAHREAEAYAKT